MRYTVRPTSNKWRLIQETGNWLNPFPWQWYATFTFYKDIVSTDTAKKLFEKYVNELGEYTIYFMVIEQHKFRGGVVHLHVLLGGVDNQIIWRHGISRVLRYNPKLGARYYLGKFIGHDFIEWDFKLA